MNTKGVILDMGAQESKLTWDDIYNEFCKWDPECATNIVIYKPWGSTSIVVWLDNGQAYKIKYQAPDRFNVQMLSKEDIDKKFGTNK